MLEKKAGNFRVDKLRAILLYEPDFNHNNKRLGRDAMYYAEDLKLLAKEQYGSRKHHSAADQGLNKELTTDLLRQKKQPGALNSNDAKACYDRMVHSVTSICLQQMGVPQEPLICMFTTIQNLNHHIRTIYGDSTISFGGKLWVVPVQSIGQGNGAGPTMWAIVSTPVLNMLRAEGCGAYFRAAITGDEIRFVGYAFVDDTDLFASSDRSDATGADVTAQLQKSLDLWEGGIRATGGAIEPDKSFWYLIDFVWHRGKWRYATEADCPAELTVLDLNGDRKVLKRLPPSQAERTLGIRLAPDGSWTDEFNYLHAQATKWADNIRVAHLPNHLVRQSMMTTIMKTLEFPLSVTCFTKNQSEALMKPILKAGLSCSGIVNNIPRELVYGTVSRQGLGYRHLYTESGIQHITRLQRFTQDVKNNTTGELLRFNMQELKMMIGLNGTVTSHSYAMLGHLVDISYVQWTWKFMDEYGMRVVDDIPDLEFYRNGDELLMQCFLQAGYRDQQLKQLNDCRLFLRVAYVSEVLTGCGTKLDVAAIRGEERLQRNPHTWPNQGRPEQDAWDLWAEALAKSLGASADGDCTVEQSVSLWNQVPIWLYWFYDRYHDRLYERTEHDEWYYWMRSVHVNRYHQRQQCEAPDLLTLEPATVQNMRSYRRITGSARIDLQPEDETHDEWLDELQNPAEFSWLTSLVTTNDDGEWIAQAIRDGVAVAISDGSFKDEFGTASWTLQGEDDYNAIKGRCSVPGPAEWQGAYRSELCGLLGIIYCAITLAKKKGITTGKLRVGCDGLSALRQVMAYGITHTPLQRHFDMISAIRRLIRDSPIDIELFHVEGHQDDDAEAMLDRFALMNIDMDAAAKAHWTMAHDSEERLRNAQIPGEGWALWIGFEKITGEIRTSITEQVHATPTEQFWIRRKRFKIQRATSQYVDWSATDHAMRNSSATRRQWVVKHVSGWAAVGKWMYRRKKWKHDCCPRCGVANETTTHVLKCQDSRAKEQWKKSLESLDTWMKTQGTHPGIRAAIISHLTAWQIDSVDPITLSQTFLNVTEAVHNQNAMGWQAFMEGSPAQGWRECQQRYYVFTRSKKTGLRWLSALVRKIWQVSWDMWEHRNGILHDKEKGQAAVEREARIRDEFEEGCTELDRDARLLFRPGRTAVLQYKAAQQRAWIARIEMARERAEIRQND
jgi:hypothetical protein